MHRCLVALQIFYGIITQFTMYEWMYECMLENIQNFEPEPEYSWLIAVSSLSAHSFLVLCTNLRCLARLVIVEQMTSHCQHLTFLTSWTFLLTFFVMSFHFMLVEEELAWTRKVKQHTFEFPTIIVISLIVHWFHMSLEVTYMNCVQSHMPHVNLLG